MEALNRRIALTCKVQGLDWLICGLAYSQCADSTPLGVLQNKGVDVSNSATDVEPWHAQLHHVARCSTHLLCRQ